MPGNIVLDLDDTLYPELLYVAQGFWSIACAAQESGSANAAEIFSALRSRWLSGSNTAFEDVRMLLNIRMSSADMLIEYRTAKRKLHLYSDVPSQLERLHSNGYRIVIISNGNADVQKAKIYSLNIEAMVDDVILTDSYGKSYWKPSPSLWKKIRLPGPAVLAIGNSDDDLLFARAGDVPFIAVERPLAVHTLSSRLCPAGRVRTLAEAVSMMKEVMI